MSRLSSIAQFAILWISGLCAAAQFSKVGLTLPELQALYPTARLNIGLLVSLVSLVGAILGLVAGLFTQYLGGRKLLILGLTSGALLSFVQSQPLGLEALLFTRLLEGASHLAIVVSAPTLIIQCASAHWRGSAMTLWGTFFGVSFAITAWLGLPVVRESGIHTLFQVHALLMALMALLVVFIVPVNTVAHHQRSLKTTALSVSDLFQQHRFAWSSPSISAPAVGWFFYTLTYVALLAIIPGLLENGLRESVATVLPLASIFSSLTLGIILLSRFNAVTCVIMGFTLAIAITSLLVIESNIALTGTLLFASLGLIQGASFAAIPELNETPGDQALASGAIAQAGNMGNLCGTPLFIYLLETGGQLTLYSGLIMAYICGILFHIVLWKRRLRL